MTGPTYEPADLADLLRDWSLAGCEHTLTLDQGRACSPCVRDRLLARFAVVDPASVVTLDPNKPDDVQRLHQAFGWSHNSALPRVEDALRSLLPTPPVPEPNGLGAVVAARHEHIAGHGIFDGQAWCFRYGGGAHHALPPGSLDIVTVEQHGVGCSCGGPGCPGGGDA